MTWTKDEVERARTRQIAPLLRDKGYRLVELPTGAVLLDGVKGLVIRGNAWVWPAQNLRGNAIDFFMSVEAKTFAEAMQLLCPDHAPRSPRRTAGHSDDDGEQEEDCDEDD